jgi:hypothetical protein
MVPALLSDKKGNSATDRSCTVGEKMVEDAVQI